MPLQHTMALHGMGGPKDCVQSGRLGRQSKIMNEERDRSNGKGGREKRYLSICLRRTDAACFCRLPPSLLPYFLLSEQRSTEAGNCRFGRFRSSGRIRYRSTCRFPKHLLRPELRLLAGASAKRAGASAKRAGASAFWPKLRLYRFYRFLRIWPKQLRPKLRPINEAEAPAGARSGGSLACDDRGGLGHIGRQFGYC